MKTQEFLTAEMKRRTDLVNDVNFINIAIEYCKKVGISADEWNKNKVAILMMLANEFCGLENKGA